MEAIQVAVLHGESEFAAGTGHLFAAARTTFACVVRDPGTWARSAARHRARARARLQVTKLVSPSVLADEPYRDQLHRMMAAGAWDGSMTMGHRSQPGWPIEMTWRHLSAWWGSGQTTIRTALGQRTASRTLAR